jgi:cytochrome d ubiquinol oxidase subunit II
MLHLHTLWFVIVAFFWTGFFVLEGFDFGVGVLHTIVGRTDTERRVAINAIGPFWDGNEVWLIVAGAAMFAAFPAWYATAFSSLYLALVLVLLALMARGVSFEYRGKSANPRWQHGWTAATVISSALIPVLVGIGLGDLLAGLPINSSHVYTGDFFDLFTPYGLWTGLTLLALSLMHGATFLTFKTSGVVSERSRRLARPLAWAASAAVLGFVIWTAIIAGRRISLPVEGLAVIAALGTAWLAHADQEGWAFAASAVAIAMTVASLFVALSPNVMVSSTNAAYNLTVSGSASGSYALKVMTISAVIFVPLVLLYQGWSFHVFRGRVSAPPAPDARPAAPPTTTAP